MWVPAGFAHGFLTLSEHAEVLYKTTDFWSRDFERAIRWDDPQMAIAWPLECLGPPAQAKGWARPAAGEEAVEQLLGASGRGVILRTSWVTGPVGRNFALTMRRLHREQGPLASPSAWWPTRWTAPSAPTP